MLLFQNIIFMNLLYGMKLLVLFPQWTRSDTSFIFFQISFILSSINVTTSNFNNKFILFMQYCQQAQQFYIYQLQIGIFQLERAPLKEALHNGKKLFISMYFRLNEMTTQIYELLSYLHQIISIRLAQSQNHVRNISGHQNWSEQYLCLALILQMTSRSQHQIQAAFKRAFHYDQTNPSIKLCYAYYLFLQRSNKVKKYLNQINLQLAANQNRYFFAEILDMIIGKEQIISQSICKNQYQIFQKQFYKNIQIISLQFNQKKIKIDRNYHKGYIIVAQILFNMDLIEEAKQYMMALQQLAPQSSQILYKLGVQFYLLRNYDLAEQCFLQSLNKNPYQINIWQGLVKLLMQQGKLIEAERWCNKLISFSQNYASYRLLGQIYTARQKYSLAIWYFLKSLSYNNCQFYTFQLIGDVLFNLDIIPMAIIFYTISKNISETFQVLNKLGVCYSKIGQQINAILFYQKSIHLDHTSLLPYLNLCQFAKQNQTFKFMINTFMEQHKTLNPDNQQLKLNIAFYYLLSKQSYKQFYECVKIFFENDEEKKEMQNFDTLFNSVSQFSLLSQQSRYQNIFFTIIIGIISQTVGNTKQSKSIFLNIMKQYNKLNFKQYSSIFSFIYKTHLSSLPSQILPIFLEFFMIEMITQNPKEMLKCYFSSINYSYNSYSRFVCKFVQIMNQNIQKIAQFQLSLNFSEKIPQNIYQSYPLYQHFPKSKQFQDNIHYMQKMLNRLKQRLKLLSQTNQVDQFIQDYLRFDNDQNLCYNKQNNTLFRCLNLREIRKNANKCYDHIINLIQKEEDFLQNSLQSLSKIYSTPNDVNVFLKSIYILISCYLQETYIVNEIIKLIIDHTSFFINKIEGIGFAEIQMSLLKFHAKMANFSKQKVVNYKKIDQQSQSQISIIESNNSFQFNFNQGLYTKDQTQSEVDQFEQHPQLSFVNQPQKKQRKYSDSNIIKVTDEDYRAFIRNITSKEQYKNILKLIIVPYKGSQQNQSAISSEQSKDQEEQYSEAKLDNQVQGQEYSFEESSQSQMNHQNKYPLKYHINNTKFKNKRLYLKFNQILFKNTFMIINYLSKRNTKKHIAKHYLTQRWNNKNMYFEADCELGDKVHYHLRAQGLQDRTTKWICFTGSKYVFQWIADIAIGIAELEELGIYQADLAIRNTIRVSRGEWSIFKIIDFDKAFKVIKTVEKDYAFQCTKQLLEFWLGFNFDEQRPMAPIDKISHFSSSQGSSEVTNSKYDETQIIKYIFVDIDPSSIKKLLFIKNDAKFSPQRLPKVLKLLQNHMLVNHKRQFKKLVEKLLSTYQLEYKEWHGQQIVIAKTLDVQRQLSLLDQGVIDYYRFAEKVREINKNH